MPIDTEEVSHQETIVDLSPHLKLYAGGEHFPLRLSRLLFITRVIKDLLMNRYDKFNNDYFYFSGERAV